MTLERAATKLTPKLPNNRQYMDISVDLESKSARRYEVDVLLVSMFMDKTNSLLSMIKAVRAAAKRAANIRIESSVFFQSLGPEQFFSLSNFLASFWRLYTFQIVSLLYRFEVVFS